MKQRTDSAAIAPAGDAVSSSPSPPDDHLAVETVTIGRNRHEATLLSFLAAPVAALPLLAALGALLFIVNLGGYPLYTKGEPREAVTVFDIVHGGGVILPMRAGVEIPSKPLLMHWLAALVSLAVGQVDEWTVRLPSAVFAILGLLACYYYVRELFDARAGLLCALIIVTTAQYLQAGRGARVDMTLTFFLTIALFEFIALAEGISARVTTMYLAVACAVLTKGPVGLALPLLVAVIWLALWRRWELLPRLRLGRGALIVGVISGGWYLAAIATGGSAFIHKQLLGENLYRLIGHTGFHEGHAHPFYYMEGALLAGFMPWSPVAVLAALQYRYRRKIDARFGYLLVWFAVVLLFYNLPQSKRGVYLLALYPALSAIIACLLGEAIFAPRRAALRCSAILAVAAGGCFILAGLAAVTGITMLYLRPLTLQSVLAHFDIVVAQFVVALRQSVRDSRTATVLIPLAALALGLWLIMWSRHSVVRMVGGVAAGMVTIMLAVNLVIEPAIANTLSMKDFATHTSRIAGEQTVGYFGSLDYAFVFYSGHNVHFVAAHEPRLPQLIVGPAQQWRLMPLRFRDAYRPLLRSNPSALDGSGGLLLLQLSRASSPASSAASTPPSRSLPAN